jgi:oxygen-independent coproporphyrinogen-3 oxidase
MAREPAASGRGRPPARESGAPAPDGLPGLYVHVPFCPRRCRYCDFYSVAGLDREGEFLAGLEAEAGRALGSGAWDRPFGSLYLGGGSPSCLPPAAVAGVFGILGRFRLAEGAEVTLEANPQDVSPAMLGLWRGLGATRVSLGVQTFSRLGLEGVLGRTHGPEEAREAASMVLDAGLELSLDLIFGWGGLTPAMWEADLLEAARAGCRHVSAYALDVSGDTELARKLKAGQLPPLPGEGVAAGMFLEAGRVLGGAGLRRYEVSNFAEPGSECRHNLRYWRRVPYLGLGPSAHSFDGSRRRANFRSLARWGKALAEGGSPLELDEALSPEQERLERIMLGMRLAEGLEEGFLDGSPALPGLVGDGFLERRGGRIAPTEKGFLFADFVARTLA